MAITLSGTMLQGGTPSVLKGSALQGSAPKLQGSTPYLQGSSPVLQPAVKAPSYQPAANPMKLSPKTVINVPGVTPAAPAPTPTPEPTPAAAPQATVSAPTYPDRTNSINANMAALEGADIQKRTGLAAIQDALSKLLGRYGAEAGANSANYNEQSTSNKNNFLRNTQAAMVNAAQGRRGLFGVLASLGALSGSGVQLANNAVQTGANADIAGANESFGANQTALDTSIGAFKSADEQRRKDAQAAADASNLNLENQVLQTKQKTYSNLAGDYATMGNEAEAKRYSDMVAALFPDIARTSVPAAPVTYSGATYSPATLNKYNGGEASTQVAATPQTSSSNLPGLFALSPSIRRKNQ